MQHPLLQRCQVNKSNTFNNIGASETCDNIVAAIFVDEAEKGTGQFLDHGNASLLFSGPAAAPKRRPEAELFRRCRNPRWAPVRRPALHAVT